MSETPETDAAAEDHRGCGNNECVHADIARKLERERDEARSVLLDTVNATVKMQEELNQLRAVCDELAAEHCQRTGIDGAFDSCLVSYRALPHVKARQ